MTDKILRCRDVQEVTGLSRSTIYRMMDRNDFPKATKLGVRAIGWRQSVVADWIEGRCTGRRIVDRDAAVAGNRAGI
ncbi:AlpA family transcriptional regulator [Sulfitobacter sp. R18_1]|uniref:helix-turn-helix transcriptional regulator n=1 Tax=Sulfitobacter sp. R18_1 TaxID=2821104 RepID=UPI001ADC4E9B|nr:AlpA family transcriptional regulator [Sulfitobacter sp. R18_1]MBO9432352.1 AlpA family transcriptional regulator [Sulfitobacter sp. R18_1]